MLGKTPQKLRYFSGLSARLLLLTMFFVMLSEVFIYAPSVARFRLTYLQERIAEAHLASLALEVPADNMVSAGLRRELLSHARSFGIVLRRPTSKALILSDDMPPKIDATVDLRQQPFFGLVRQAFVTLSGDGGRYFRIVDTSPQNPRVTVETVIAERPLRDEMVAYSFRILALSIVISLTTAVLVFLSLQWLFVGPMRGITSSMINFRKDPEDGRRVIEPGGRKDEIGIAQRELAEMQIGLRAALQQRARLAALGTAVTKINHDLRNILASAQLVSDHLGTSDDPKVKRIAPTLLGAIDRAVTLCTQTLRFAQEGGSPLKLGSFALDGLIGEVETALADVGTGGKTLWNRVDPGFKLYADREQIFRVLFNLVRNAFDAGAGVVTIDAHMEGGAARIEIADNGPGLPSKVRDNLFQPFAGVGREGGTGLGLPIAHDLMCGHGGDIELGDAGATGTMFILTLPVEGGAVEDKPRIRVVDG